MCVQSTPNNLRLYDIYLPSIYVSVLQVVSYLQALVLFVILISTLMLLVPPISSSSVRSPQHKTTKSVKQASC